MGQQLREAAITIPGLKATTKTIVNIHVLVLVIRLFVSFLLYFLCVVLFFFFFIRGSVRGSCCGFDLLYCIVFTGFFFSLFYCSRFTFTLTYFQLRVISIYKICDRKFA